jgi:hypothetical protein
MSEQNNKTDELSMDALETVAGGQVTVTKSLSNIKNNMSTGPDTSSPGGSVPAPSAPPATALGPGQ